MRTIEEVKDRCFVTEDGHWLWRGALRPSGRPHISAPDFTKRAGAMVTQGGARAVWHIVKREPVPEGHRVFMKCEHPTCCNPDCMRTASEHAYGRFRARNGQMKGQPRRIVANRAIGAKRASLNAEQMLYVQTSPKTGVELSAELGVSRTTICKVRRGGYVVAAAGAHPNPFAALMR